MLTDSMAVSLARIGLGHVAREYPNKLDHVLDGPADVATPRQLHPIFFGSFDWHSCVHSYWMLARILRRFPDAATSGAIRAALNAAFTPEAVAGECAYFARPTARGFERPYGWGWLMALAAELMAHDDRRWAEILRPLVDIVAERFKTFLPLAIHPVRAGTHGNTAFALRLAADYADRAQDDELATLLAATAARWYGRDADCQAWEPSGDDFLSSALIEAECMRRLLPPDRFAPWFMRFLPRLERGEPATLFEPVVSSDRTDGKLAHLDGLNLSRAWCWTALLPTLADVLSARPRVQAAIDRHRAASLPSLAGHYMGEHWLASFALLAFDGA